MLVFSCEQLFDFADVFTVPEHRADVLITGLGRTWDYRNRDMVKHHAKSPEVSKMLYQRIGILNMFNPLRPDGEYLLNLGIYEEKMVAKLLCELAKSEGFQLMTDIKVPGQGAVEKMTNEIARALPDYGNFECKYNVPEDKVKEEVREKMGQKYFDWPL